MSKLYVVGTPIGNLQDFSPRALQTLREVDFIAAEDTRVTRKLLTHFGLQKPMVSYFAHNLRARGQQIVARISAGESCAIVTDAGMPCISDPGEDLVALCAAKGIPIEVVPGPSAAVSALAVSGLPTGRFSFEGFLSVSRASRRRHLEELRGDPRTLLFYEAPHKLLATLRDLYEVLGQRRVALAKELTKVHERVLRTTLAEAIALFEGEQPRGEFVLVVEGAKKEAEAPEKTPQEAAALVRRAVEAGRPLSQAAKEVAALTGYPKSELYRLALKKGE